MNPKSYHDKSFQFVVTIALGYKQIENHLEKKSKIKFFVKNIFGKKRFFHHTKNTKKGLK